MSSPKNSPKKVTKKVAPKKPAQHPKYSEMVQQAISSLKERNGSSRQAVLKYITSNFKVGDGAGVNSHLKLALKRGVASGVLIQSKGTGASGSFKLGKKVEKPKKPIAKKPAAKKAAAKKATPKKKAAAKRATPKKKAAAKKPANTHTHTHTHRATWTWRMLRSRCQSLVVMSTIAFRVST